MQSGNMAIRTSNVQKWWKNRQDFSIVMRKVQEVTGGSFRQLQLVSGFSWIIPGPPKHPGLVPENQFQQSSTSGIVQVWINSCLSLDLSVKLAASYKMALYKPYKF